MKVQILIISAIVSAMAWVAAFEATRGTYHAGMAAGLIPNLHIKQNLIEAVSAGPVPWHFRSPLSGRFG